MPLRLHDAERRHGYVTDMRQLGSLERCRAHVPAAARFVRYLCSVCGAHLRVNASRCDVAVLWLLCDVNVIVSCCDVDVRCNPPPDLPHGYYTCKPNNCDQFNPGTIAQYQCVVGYTMKPEHVVYQLICDRDGMWKSFHPYKHFYCSEGKCAFLFFSWW